MRGCAGLNSLLRNNFTLPPAESDAGAAGGSLCRSEVEALFNPNTPHLAEARLAKGMGVDTGSTSSKGE